MYQVNGERNYLHIAVAILLNSRMKRKKGELLLHRGILSYSSKYEGAEEFKKSFNEVCSRI
jgi:hypothetical protein